MSVELPPVLPYFDTLAHAEASNPWLNDRVARIVMHHGVEDAALVYEHLLDWLAENDSPNLYKAYRSEATTLLIWAWDVERLPLAKINRKRLRDYILWCQQPPADWVATAPRSQLRLDKQLGERVPNPRWRPFVNRQPRDAAHTIGDSPYQLSHAAIRTKLSIVSTLFQYLISEEYCEHNPAQILLALDKWKERKQHRASDEDNEQIKSMTDLQWSYVMDACDRLAAEDPARNERSRFLVILLYAVYPRISELSARPGFSPTMAQFRRDKKTGVLGFFIPRSKGGKSRTVAVSRALVEALARYRRHLGVSDDLPAANDTLPLFVRQRAGTTGRDKGYLNANLGDRRIRDLVQEVFERAAKLLADDGFDQDAHEVRAMTVHCIRHTGISHDINYHCRPLAHVQADAGHDSLDTTSRYVWTSRVERHESARDKQLHWLSEAD